MKILITGAAGFIGSHLTIALLNSGHAVVGIDNFDPFYPRAIKESNIKPALANTDFQFFEKDICDIQSYEEQIRGIDCVIHLAAKAGVRPSIQNPNAYIQSNIVGTQSLLDFMERNAIRKLVFASSSSIYGNNKTIPFSEKDIVDFPISPYAYTKKCCELMIHTAHHLNKLDALCLRFFTVYGPGQRPDLAIHKFFKLISENRPLTMYGDGSTARDYTYIDDIVQGIILAMNHVVEKQEVYEILNIGNNTPVKLRDLIENIYRISSKSKQVKQLEMQPGDVDITFSNIEKAKNMIGYQPTTSIEVGLDKFYNWFTSKNIPQEIASS